MNTPINFEASKLLKEKGFDKKCLVYVPINEPEKSNCDFTQEDWDSLIYSVEPMHCHYSHFTFINAPIISDVVMWLYEEHGIWIYPILILENRKFVINIDKIEPKFQWQIELFDSPTKAYEAAILYVLENLI